MWCLTYVASFFTLLVIQASADDRFTCCMGGWKEMRGVTLCAAPCCPGYEERALKMPLLKSPVVCHKLTEEELKKKEEERRTTVPPATEKELMDEPRRIIRASSEYEEFLYRHRHFFLSLLNEGYSRKELITNLEQFLNRITSVMYQPNWYRG
ncbi:uncharacterized protein [Palaemon carinicauda]|uniref:uncharacterized protein n=1 Tax=Palaemon carinicauda TaxID=392227 RepID=UPI0035B5BDC5